MKTHRIALLLASAMLAVACEGPMGPAGPAGSNGSNGTNGTNGTNGKDANTSCLSCHSTAKMTAMGDQYALSKHFTGNTSARNTKWCAGCHTSEGFLEKLSANKFTVSNDIPNATRIGCGTCHKHSGFDFAVDTTTAILQTTAPVALYYDQNLKTTDFGKLNNLCVNCHQIRGATSTTYTDSLGASKTFVQLPFFPFSPTKDDNASVNYQVGQSFSVHDGNQSNLFAGKNAYEYTGVAYTRTWKHSDWSCTTCHMNKYDPTTKLGGHTLKPNEAICESCHTSDKIVPTQDKINAKRIELGDLLAARKVFKKTVNATTGVASYSAIQTHDFYGRLFLNTASTNKYGTALVSANTVSPTTGLVLYNNTVTMGTDAAWADRIGRPWKMGELGAAYNYGYINSELSLGVHNPVYAMQVLQASIDWLKSHP